MKANELRIGNLIIDDEGLIAKINGFKPHEHLTRCDTNEGCQLLIDAYRGDKIERGYIVDLDNCKPIPITKELLLNLGFELKHEYGNIYVLSTNPKVVFSFHEHNKEHFGVQPNGFAALIRCDYVHELQNICFYVNDRQELKFIKE